MRSHQALSIVLLTKFRNDAKKRLLSVELDFYYTGVGWNQSRRARDQGKLRSHRLALVKDLRILMDPYLTKQRKANRPTKSI